MPVLTVVLQEISKHSVERIRVSTALNQYLWAGFVQLSPEVTLSVQMRITGFKQLSKRLGVEDYHAFLSV